MKLKLTLLALIAGASMVAQAQTPAAAPAASGAKAAAPTRAEVKAEATAANKAGTIDASNTAGSKVEKPVKSDKSRADVKKGHRCCQQGRQAGQSGCGRFWQGCQARQVGQVPR
jgi:hypothetical protein